MDENIPSSLENYSKYYPPRITDTWPPLIHEEKKKIKYPGSHLPPLLSDYVPPTLYDKPESNSHAPTGKGTDFKEPHIVYPTNSGESFTQYENAWNMNESTVFSHREITLGSQIQSKPEQVILNSKRFYQQLVTTPQTDETQVYRKPMAEHDSPINPIEYTTININPKSPGINIVIKDKPRDTGINSSIPSPSSSETLDEDEDFEYYDWYDDDDESYMIQPDYQPLQDNNQLVPGVGSKEGPAPNASKPSLVPEINYKPVFEENQYLPLSEDNTQYSKDNSKPGIYSTGKE